MKGALAPRASSSVRSYPVSDLKGDTVDEGCESGPRIPTNSTDVEVGAKAPGLLDHHQTGFGGLLL
jgi:hypothetical protein